jgi:hypothetical protein
MIGDERLWVRQRKTAGADLTNGENAAAERMKNGNSLTTFYDRFGGSVVMEPNSNED